MSFEERLKAPTVINEDTAIILLRYGTAGTSYSGYAVMPQFHTIAEEVRAHLLNTGELIGYGPAAYRRAKELCDLENGLREMGVL